MIKSEEEDQFQPSNNCWICEKLIADDNEKVRYHYHVTGTFRDTVHWSGNINFQLTKKISVIFDNLRGYDRHLIFYELNKSDVKIDVIPNRLENRWHFFKWKLLIVIDSMQFMNSSLEKLVKNLLDNGFKYLTEYMGIFKKLDEEKLPDKTVFTSL